MKTAWLPIGAVFFASLAAACPEAEVIVEQRTAIDQGKKLFSDPRVGGSTFNELSCNLCHAEHDGESTSLLAGAPLAGATQRPSYWGGQETTLLGAINACLYYFMLADRDWKGDEPEAEAIYAYLESLPASDDEKAPWPFTIAPLTDGEPADDGLGKALYADACASCHGAKTTGQGRKVARAPILPDDTLAEHPLGEYTALERRVVFVEKTRHGGFLGYGGQMPPFSAEILSDEQMLALLGYLGVP